MAISLPVAAQVIVLALAAAFLGGVARFGGGKAKLPDWASFALGLFVFALVILVFHIA